MKKCENLKEGAEDSVILVDSEISDFQVDMWPEWVGGRFSSAEEGWVWSKWGKRGDLRRASIPAGGSKEQRTPQGGHGAQAPACIMHVHLLAPSATPETSWDLPRPRKKPRERLETPGPGASVFHNEVASGPISANRPPLWLTLFAGIQGGTYAWSASPSGQLLWRRPSSEVEVGRRVWSVPQSGHVAEWDEGKTITTALVLENAIKMRHYCRRRMTG